MSEQREHVIRERAYALWEQDGRPDGRSLAHWSQAEAEIAIEQALVTQEKVLTAQARQAVAKLAAAGIAFAITSGRPPRGMQTVIKDVNLSTVVAGFNGGVYTTAKLDPIAALRFEL